MNSNTAICTWFVADDASSGTYFPQVGNTSDAPEAQEIYWRCAVCFFASSIVVNPEVRHLFFTNTFLPTIDGANIATLFASWDVEVITLPITYRLPADAVKSWGNQFYIFDILDYFVMHPPAARAIVLDSDCLWLKPVDEMVAAIDAHGALTYELGDDEYCAGSVINGLSREQMARFVHSQGGPDLKSIPYCGGEIYAASQAVTEQLAARVRTLWPQVVSQDCFAPREEAHFLSILYQFEGIKVGTANRFIRRMWTTFQHNNLAESDLELTVWHLPAEKKTGFSDLFQQIVRQHGANRAELAEHGGLNFNQLACSVGWPKRRPAKLMRDLALKIREKLGHIM